MADTHVVTLSQIWSIWKRAVTLAAPVTVENILRTLMRTTDILVAGTLSPAAVAAIGVGDSFSRIINRVGGGLGDATIALSSQDTGAEAFTNRDEAITQTFLIGFLIGIPFIVFGLLFSRSAVKLLGANHEVVQFGGQYLGLIMMAAPMIHFSKIGAKALQGTGDTQTPMYIRGFGNILNIIGTVVLAFGLGPFPPLSVVGIALATVLGEGMTGLLFFAVIYRPASDLHLVYPRQLTITKQVLQISLPRAGEGTIVMVADVPFNGILLAMGTEVNAAYHIARRVYQQILGPIYRAFGVATNILVGQSLGQNTNIAYISGVATTALGLGVASLLSILLFLGRIPLVGLFTDDAATSILAIGFVQAFAIGGIFYTVFSGFRGGLRGGSDTRSPFLATLIGMFAFLLGMSYFGGIHLEFGVFAVFLAIIFDFSWRAAFLGIVYYRQNWIGYGTSLMEERGSINTDVEDSN